MSKKISAYLSIFNDWDILPAALRSIAKHVDDLVVVDGAYEWMLPYLTRLGIDPHRSDRRVYAALEQSGIPFRVICRVWRNEPEKRQTGYEACVHPFIYRIDADEILFFDDPALERMLSRGSAVGEMDMPAYITPEWIAVADSDGRIGRQGLLFDRNQVTAAAHLGYLWLVPEAGEPPLPGTKPFPIHPEPIAYNAHLTSWRTPASSANRAAFYVLNWVRQNAVPELHWQPLGDLNLLFDAMPPRAFMGSLRWGFIAAGTGELQQGQIIRPSPLGADKEASFANLYPSFLDSLAAMNADAASEAQPFATIFPVILDLTTSAARDAIVSGGNVVLEFSAGLQSAAVELNTYAATTPQISRETLPFELRGRELRFMIPKPPDASRQMLRENVEILVSLDSPSPAQTFIARAS
jgi:hypothetical protein